LSIPKITIVTPSYNQAVYLEKTILSVIEQKDPNLEYIIQDGGSNDGSVDILEKYNSQISFWESKPDGGQSAGINKGFEKAEGDYLMWLNSDDLLAPNALKNLRASGALQPRTIVAGICRHFDEKKQTQEKFQTGIQSFQDALNLKEIWYAGGQITQPETIFPRDLFRQVGGLNTHNHYAMDYELWLRMLANGGCIQNVDFEIGHFRRHSEQKVASSDVVFEELLKTARVCVHEFPGMLTETERVRVLSALETFELEWWTSSGRLSKLKLPKKTLMRIRKWHQLKK
jgi:glycosyltransferase involved in cell wall biosynthesis